MLIVLTHDPRTCKCIQYCSVLFLSMSLLLFIIFTITVWRAETIQPHVHVTSPWNVTRATPSGWVNTDLGLQGWGRVQLMSCNCMIPTWRTTCFPCWVWAENGQQTQQEWLLEQPFQGSWECQLESDQKKKKKSRIFSYWLWNPPRVPRTAKDCISQDFLCSSEYWCSKKVEITFPKCFGHPSHVLGQHAESSR